MPFPTNPTDGQMFFLGTKYFIYKSPNGWIEQEPSSYFVQDTKPTANFGLSRTGVWYNPTQGVIYLWQDGKWVQYLTVCK